MSSFADLVDSYVEKIVIPAEEQFDSGRVVTIADSRAVAECGLLDEIFSSSKEAQVPALSCSIVKVAARCGNLRNLFLVNYGMVGRLLQACESKNSDIVAEFESLKKGEAIGALAMTEESGGSNSKKFTTRITRSNGVARLNGKKTWITLGDIADFYIVQAWIDEDLRFVYVPKKSSGVSSRPISDLMGCRGSALGIVTFQDVEINEDNLLPNKLQIFGGISSNEYVIRNGRLFAGASGLGMGMSALNAATKILLGKKNFRGALYFQGNWQSKISELYIRSVAINELLLRIVENFNVLISLDQDKFTPLKILGTQFAMECTELLVKSVGAEGFKEVNFANRLWRESNAGEFIEGGNVVLTSKCAQDWMKMVLSRKMYA
jgi:glutaryl-CoA dehydrogenase (non-decarboxylating)